MNRRGDSTKKKTENVLKHFGCNSYLVKSHLNAHATDIMVIAVMVWFASSVQDENRHFIVDG